MNDELFDKELSEFKRFVRTELFSECITYEVCQPSPPNSYQFSGKLKSGEVIKLEGSSWRDLLNKLPERVKV